MTDQTNTTTPPTDKAIMDQVALASFVNDVIKAKNDNTITEQELPGVKEVLLGEVNEALNTHLVNLLSERSQIELSKLLDSNPSDEQLNYFFVKSIPNLEIEITAALLNFRAAYLYPIREQIARAVETLAPLPSDSQSTNDSSHNQNIQNAVQNSQSMPAPVAPVALAQSANIHNVNQEQAVQQMNSSQPASQNNLLDFQLPPAPPAPLPPSMQNPSAMKKWN